MKHHLSIIALSFALAALTAPSAWADKGILQISTSPGDAEIYINGKRKGNSPENSKQAFVIQLEEGEYTIEARQLRENEQYNDSELWRASKKIYVADDTIQSVTLSDFTFELSEEQRQQRMRTLTVHSNVFGDEVFIDGKSYGATPVTVELLMDSYKVEVRKDGHKPHRERVQLYSNYTLTATLIDIIRELQDNMVKIPAGEFRMGDIQGDGSIFEYPVHRVSVSEFWLSKTEVTFEQWDICVTVGGCRHRPSDRRRGSRPVIRVSWEDITEQFIPWLNKTTGKQYRLPSEAEWEYAARAGSDTKYSWGNNIGNNKANCKGCGSLWDNIMPAPVGSFTSNAFGLYDMHGNVSEWTQDCWNSVYKSAPSDGSAWLSGKCYWRVSRGGSWDIIPRGLRSAYRNNNSTGNRYNNIGFRLARTLD